MQTVLTKVLTRQPVVASAPCRIDMGGTLDIAPIYFPLRYLAPTTFNIAINLRTSVALYPYQDGMVKVSSSGFASAEFPLAEAPFDHPLGLVFAVAAHFNTAGVHIVIESASPVRSALGGSSAAAVALIGALTHTTYRSPLTHQTRKRTALLAHSIEESVAGVLCGRQDQLAAAYGGVNAWSWRLHDSADVYAKEVMCPPHQHAELQRHLLLAYVGHPHESKNINRIWLEQFIRGAYRKEWREIVVLTQKFIDAFKRKNYKVASDAMHAEVALRRKMTPAVVDGLGEMLIRTARQNGCGARFTGAGGGGCIWALGAAENIDKLRFIWEELLQTRDKATLLRSNIAPEGVVIETVESQQ